MHVRARGHRHRSHGHDASTEVPAAEAATTEEVKPVDETCLQSSECLGVGYWFVPTCLCPCLCCIRGSQYRHQHDKAEPPVVEAVAKEARPYEAACQRCVAILGFEARVGLERSESKP